MTFKKALSEVLTGKKPAKDVIHYLLGNYRYFLYYSIKPRVSYADIMKVVGKRNKHPLMRQHIYEQIEYRIKWMDEGCYNSGECKKCGCSTTQLQMCNKPCDGKCYPAMMNK